MRSRDARSAVEYVAAHASALGILGWLKCLIEVCGGRRREGLAFLGDVEKREAFLCGNFEIWYLEGLRGVREC